MSTDRKVLKVMRKRLRKEVGFMMAQAVAELMAEWMTGRGRDEIFERFAVERFAGGGAVREDFIIG